MSGAEDPPASAGDAGLAERIESHADALEQGRRSPLTVALMRGAAADARASGIASKVFPAGPGRPGSVPALRLVSAIHQLVLEGSAPALERFYPSVGGNDPPVGVWEVAADAISANLPRTVSLAQRTVQTNEPGRAVVLYGALLQLAERYGMPIRLFEIGASAGLNLHPDRFRYVVQGETLGDPRSPLEFIDPWLDSPVEAPPAVSAQLAIPVREGCDLNPIDVHGEKGSNTLISYVWPDEALRLRNVRAAIEVARAHDPAIEQASAAEWLERNLAAPHDQMTVVWQSVVWQYLPQAEQEAIERVLGSSGNQAGQPPLAWIRMEPSGEHMSDFSVRCRHWPGGEDAMIATAANHGPPVRWGV